MSDTLQDGWFYSRGGEKTGPVALSVLQIKAAEGSLNPRHDLVWTQGMAEWKPAGEIEGLFERRAVAEPPEIPASPYQPPAQESVTDPSGQPADWPGARRRSYLVANLVVPFVISLGAALGTPFLQQQFGPEGADRVLLGAVILPALIAIYFTIQRLANLGMSRWWFFGNFVPILNLWLGFRCFACPGGYAFHKKLDGIGIFLAIVYWLVVAIAVLVIAAFIAVMAGALGDPALRDQIQEIMRNAAAAPKP